MRVSIEMLLGDIIAFGRSVTKPQNAAAPTQTITKTNPKNICMKIIQYYRSKFTNGQHGVGLGKEYLLILGVGALLDKLA
jgi:hypothetical protein